MIRIKTALATSEDNPANAAEHLTAARAIADQMSDPALASQVDAVAAHCAIDAGELERAGELAHRSLIQAQAAGPQAWAAAAPFDALLGIGRTERARNIEAARAAFERAYRIAAHEDFAVRRIKALHELGTIDMLQDGSMAKLTEARELASKSGAMSTVTV